MALSKIQSESIDLADDFAGMRFGGTATENSLNDFERGTFTPSLTESGNASFSATFDGIKGAYMKVGPLVYVHIKVRTSGTSNASTGQLQVSLPFAAVHGSGGYYGSDGRINAEVTGGSGAPLTGNLVMASIANGASVAKLQQQDSGNLYLSNFTGSGGIRSGADSEFVVYGVYQSS